MTEQSDMYVWCESCQRKKLPESHTVTVDLGAVNLISFFLKCPDCLTLVQQLGSLVNQKSAIQPVQTPLSIRRH